MRRPAGADFRPPFWENARGDPPDGTKCAVRRKRSTVLSMKAASNRHAFPGGSGT
jgi:hypothetical protein